MSGIKHRFQSEVEDSGDTSIVRPSNWNDDHDVVSALQGQFAAPGRMFYAGQLDATVGTAPDFDLVDGEIDAVPFVAHRDAVIDSLSVGVTVSDNTADLFLGIYDSDEEGYPNERLFSSPAIDISGTGVKTASDVSTAITGGGLYWVAVLATEVEASPRIGGIHRGTGAMGILGREDHAFNANTGIFYSHNTGHTELLDPFPSDASVRNDEQIPRVSIGI